MNNNDVLRNIRYIFSYNDEKMIALFASVEESVERSQICAWLKKDDEPGFVELSDKLLATFLNALIIEKRGKKDDTIPVAEETLTNNIILRKLRIALDFKDEDMLEALKLANFRLSKYELSAFFRRPDSRNYRVCKNQILRNFLKGLKLKIGPTQGF